MLTISTLPRISSLADTGLSCKIFSALSPRLQQANQKLSARVTSNTSSVGTFQPRTHAASCSRPAVQGAKPCPSSRALYYPVRRVQCPAIQHSLSNYQPTILCVLPRSGQGACHAEAGSSSSCGKAALTNLKRGCFSIKPDITCDVGARCVRAGCSVGLLATCYNFGGCASSTACVRTLCRHIRPPLTR